MVPSTGQRPSKRAERRAGSHGACAGVGRPRAGAAAGCRQVTKSHPTSLTIFSAVRQSRRNPSMTVIRGALHLAEKVGLAFPTFFRVKWNGHFSRVQSSLLITCADRFASQVAFRAFQIGDSLDRINVQLWLILPRNTCLLNVGIAASFPFFFIFPVFFFLSRFQFLQPGRAHPPGSTADFQEAFAG